VIARIKAAREALGWTQEALAEKVGLSRTSVTELESGKREIRIAELARFADALGRPITYFLSEEVEVKIQFEPLLRALPSRAAGLAPSRSADKVLAAAKGVLLKFENLCKMYVELEEINEQSPPALPTFPFRPGRGIYRDAENLADSIRGQLGLGPSAPAQALRDLIENRWGVKTFVLKAAGNLSGAAIHDDRAGGCILVTVRSIPHMLFTLAHELAHLLVHRDRPMVDFDLHDGSTEEKFANAFAAALLMPRAAVQEVFWSTYQSRAQITDIDVIRISRLFGVSFNAMLSRLQGLHLLASGERERILREYKASGTGPVLRARDAGVPDDRQPFWPAMPDRYVFLAIRAYDREEISIGRLAEYLRHADGHQYSIEEAVDFIARYRLANAENGGRVDHLPE